MTIDQRRFRDALGTYPTGVTVITTQTPTGPLGITVNSFASLSLDPPLIMWAPSRQSQRFEAFAGADRFAIHILAEHQEALAKGFAQSGTAPFEAEGWSDAADKAPEFEGCAAILHCQAHARFPGGDHDIVVGQVISFRHDASRKALLFHKGLFRPV